MKYLNLTKVTLTVVMATQLMGTKAFSQDEMKDPYFQLTTAKVRELTDEEALEYANEEQLSPELVTKQVTVPNIPPRPPKVGDTSGGLVAAGGGGGTTAPTPTPTGAIDGVIMIIDKLIAIGQKIIPTIEKGKAVVTNTSMAAVSVLPRIDTKDPVVHDMGGWTIPKTKHYQITVNNKLGSQVANFVYSVTYQYNGTYGGKGKYLTGIRASARSINISWGFDLDATSQLLQISNVGTQENIIAGATIEMSYTIKNWTGQQTRNVSFFVAGDGRLYKLD